MKSAQCDVFSGTFAKDATWLEAVEGVKYAEVRMRLFAAEVPGTYFVFSHRSHRIVAAVDTTNRVKPKP